MVLGDVNKVLVCGFGLEFVGNVVNKFIYFDIYIVGVGIGDVVVVIVDL